MMGFAWVLVAERKGTDMELWMWILVVVVIVVIVGLALAAARRARRSGSVLAADSSEKDVQ